MTIGRIIIALGAAIVVSFIVACVYAVTGWKDGEPIVTNSLNVESPDKEWVAVWETVDNGLGFGQGALYDEVHIRRPGETIFAHGDRARSGVFYIEAMGATGDSPQVTWRDSQHLIIRYDKRRSNGNGPGRSVTSWHGISIVYQPEPGA